MVNYGNRGMNLEKLIDKTNDNYRCLGMADIRKIPPPVKILSSSKGIVKGHLMKPSWVDYSGIYESKYIIFDAKETKQKSFPLKNISNQQYNLLKSFSLKGAVAFILIHFTAFDKYYYIPFETLEWACRRQTEGGRKSISLEDAEKYGQEVLCSFEYGLNYLGVIE